MTEEALFDLALNTSPSGLAALLDRECTDPVLRARVEALLAAHATPRAAVDASATGPTLDVPLNMPPEVAPEPPTRATADHVPPTDVEGRMLAGRYKLIEHIGEGGMGSVWLAQQSMPVKRRVAVKLIKPGMDSRQVVARFEAERQALAMMDHPNIAKVLDGGLTADGRPFFVMELVKGVPITDYCDAMRLTPQQRLELFVPVTQAIQHAHQKGIIHRDINPSNVLIAMYDDKPVPKVIDFGVAKATGQQLSEHTINTGFGGVVGTPQYMSPEQATFNNLDIDTRSDVYSLGVLLYELLAGSPPFSRPELANRGLLEILRVVREEEPPKPSTKLSSAEAYPSLSANRGTEPKKLTALLRSELDWIVMKSLEKDRTRRYETANAFAADVQRYLLGEAVLAHPPGSLYRLRKAYRKNRGPVLAGMLVMAVLMLGMLGTTFGLIRAERARADETTQRQLAEAKEREANDERVKAVAASEEEARQRGIAEKEKKKAVEFRNKALDALRATTGDDVEKLLGEKKELTANEKAYLEAIAKRWQTFANQEGTDEQSRAMDAEWHYRVAYLWLKLGRRIEARPEFEKAVALFEKLAADFPAVPDYQRDLAKSHGNLGVLLADLGTRAEVEEQYRKGLAIEEKLVAEFPAVLEYRFQLASSHNNLGIMLADLGKSAESEEQYHKGLAIQEKLAANFPAVPEYRRDLAKTHGNLGDLLIRLGRRGEAEQQSRKALAIQEKLVAEFPAVPFYRRDLALSCAYLGHMLAGLGKRADAENQYEKGLAIQEKLVAEFPAVPYYRRDLALSHNNLGLLLAGLGKPLEAENESRKGLAIRAKLAADFPAVPDYRRDLANSHGNLGDLLADLGKLAEAEEQHRTGLAIQEKLAVDFPAVINYLHNLSVSHNNLGLLLAGLGKRAEAEEQYKKGLAIDEKMATEFPSVPGYRCGLALKYTNLANLLADLGKRAEAEEQYNNGLAIQVQLVADFPAVPHFRHDLANTHSNLGNLLADLGKRAEASEQYKKGLAIREKLANEFVAVPEYRRNLALSHNSIGLFLAGLGKPAEAEEQHRMGLAIQEKLAADFPAVPEYRVDMGGSYCNFGGSVRISGRSADSLAWYDKAIDTLRPVHEAEPRAVTAKRFLRNSHLGRATACDAIGKHAEAVRDWDKAVELSPPEEQPTHRANRATSLSQAGQLAKAVAEVAELTRSPDWDSDQWYNFACVYATASRKIADKKLEYADRAMELLQKSVKAGYKDTANMNNDTDLDPLRDRVDFRKLIAQLEAKGPQPAELAPPPREKK